MKKIQLIHLLTADIMGKNTSTWQPPDRLDRIIYDVILATFNEHYDHYVKNQKISDFLLPLKRTAEIEITNGVGALPVDYMHVREIFNGDVEVDLVEDKFWAGRINRKVGPVSEARPICRIEDSGESTETKIIDYRPVSDCQLTMHYFRKPTMPVYAFTVTASRYVYNDAGSTDIDFPINMVPMIVSSVLGKLGNQTREQDVQQFAERNKLMESTK